MFNIRNPFKKKEVYKELEEKSNKFRLFKKKESTAELVQIDKVKPATLTKAEILANNKKKPNNHSKVKYKKPQVQMTKKMKKVLENPKKKGF